MLKSILVGLDGSSFSQSALEIGIDWARRFNALLIGLGIIDEPTICSSEVVPLGAGAYKQHSDEVRLARATRQVEQFLEQFTLRCTEAGVASKVLEVVGDPHERIFREAQRYDLILLGQQTYFHFATQEEPCKTLKTILKNTPRPVITVPEKLSGGSSIIVGFDGSLQAARALQAFEGTGLDSAYPIHVVTVNPDHVEASRHADRAIDFLGFHDIKATPHVVASSQPPARVLLDLVRQLDACLVVMGAYGQPALREFFLGSVSRTMLKESSVPLFLYH